MARPQKVTSRQIIEAINSANGLVVIAARKLGVRHQTICERANREPEIRAVIDENINFVLDAAESKLYQAINNGEAWAICFFLKTRGKYRGYTERQEISGPDGNPIKYEIHSLTDAELERIASGGGNRAAKKAESPTKPD